MSPRNRSEAGTPCFTGGAAVKPGVTKIYRLDDLFSMTQNEQRSLVPLTSVGLEVFVALWWRSGRMQVKVFPD